MSRTNSCRRALPRKTSLSLSALSKRIPCALYADAARHAATSRAALDAGRSVSAEAATQYLGYLDQIDGFVQSQLGGQCATVAPPAAAAPPPA